MSNTEKPVKKPFLSKGTKVFFVFAVILGVYGSRSVTPDVRQQFEDEYKQNTESFQSGLKKELVARGVLKEDGSFTQAQNPNAVTMANQGSGASSSVVVPPVPVLPTQQGLPSTLPQQEKFKSEFDALWSTLESSKTPSAKVMKDAAWLKMYKWASQDQMVRLELLGRFVSVMQPEFRVRLRELVRQINTDDVVDFCLRQLASTDLNTHREGLYLLQGPKAQSSKVQEVLRRLLKTETDEQSLTYVLAMMYPTLQLTQQQIGEIGDRLMMLAKHPNPLLRLGSLAVMVKFDRTATITEELVFKALSDPDSRVRYRAIGLVGEANLQSQRVKQALFTLVETPAESRENRKAALASLGNFRLSDAEANSLKQLRQQYAF